MDTESAAAPGALLAATLGVDAARLQREVLDRKTERVVERVVWSGPDGRSQAACVKYGSDPRLDREAAAYRLLLDPGRDAVPHLLAHRVLPDGSRLLVTAWLEGRTASFWPAEGAVTPAPDIRAVFAAMGVWQAGWAERLHEGAIRRDLEKRGIPPEIEAGWRAIRDDVRDARFYEEALRRNAGAALIREALLREVGGDRAVATCRATAQRAAALARGIVTVPQTLDPGDFANENVLLRPDGTVALLDFEYAAFAPVVQVFESVGDDWESQPPADQAEAALKTYVEAWNGAGAIPLPWTAFLAAHRRLRIHRKALDLSANLRDLDDARHGRPTPDYDAGASAQDAARALCDLLATVDGGP